MNEWVLRIPWAGASEEVDALLAREWLAANGLGGYASGTVSGAVSRRYHGLLIAALPTPLGRRVMLNHLSEWVRTPNGSSAFLGGEERSGKVHVPGAAHLTEFRLDASMPVWRFDVHGTVLEKRVLLPHGQNTVHIQYSFVSGPGPARLKLRPAVHFRAHEAPVDAALDGHYAVTAIDERYEVAIPQSLVPPLRFFLHGSNRAFTMESVQLHEVHYRKEAERGYHSIGTLWSPGYFRATLHADSPITLIASTESWETILALAPEQALTAERERQERNLAAAHVSLQTPYFRELILAADQFIVTPSGRIEDAARALAAGDEVRTVIAGYHWFTDWGRDTMISLEGLTLATGRSVEAGYILRTFAQYVHNGLIPNLFPEGERQGLYHTADATMWFFHAIDRYLAYTEDRTTLQLLLPKLQEIIEWHLRGTDFGIAVDPRDGLLRQGAEGYQLTWMDAKVGDWVVTPRRGKPVEINALWYNALRLLERWLREEKSQADAEAIRKHAEQVYESFNRRFWFEAGGYLYDVVDGENGDDSACRPNQVFAISLPNPVLHRDRWQSVMRVVEEQLLTPVGLRSLAPNHPDFKARYDGDLRARDAAYHQGTVWAWLIGPYIDAWRKIQRDCPAEDACIDRFLAGFKPHLSEACVGSISEVFDAQPPFTPRGCISQAWSVAEVLRCRLTTDH